MGRADTTPLSPDERRLLDEFQQQLPDSPRPFAAIGARLGMSEAEVIASLERLRAGGYVSRVGPVLRPHSVGASTLAAMAVPEERLEAVAELVNSFDEVNHNYEREHHYNLWFVVTAADEAGVKRVLAEISREAGLPVLDLPMLADFHIDLGFKLWA